METKLYIRDGRRFKYVPNMVGMYWNGIILTKERIQDSIAVVIEQHYDHVVMAFLKMSKEICWYEAEVWCRDYFQNGRLPSKRELISLSNYIDITSNIWGEERDDRFAWYLWWRSREIVFNYKYRPSYMKAIAVTDVPILNLI